MNYHYEDIILRAIEQSDLELIREMMNDPEIEHMIGGYSFPISEHEQNKWFNTLSLNNKELRTIIQTKDYGTIGLVMLTDIDWKNRNAEIHTKIATSVNIKGKGYGTKAKKAMIKYAFEELNLKLIYSHIIEYNIASQKVNEKCGFKKEGVLRNRVYKNGIYHNITIWSIERSEIIQNK